MGFFSNIVDNFKGAVLNLADSSLNIIGNITNILKHEPQIVHAGYEPSSIGAFEEYGYDDLYDDYVDWIFEIDS